MRSKTFRIPVIAACAVVFAAEIILIIHIIGKGKGRKKAETALNTESDEGAVLSCLDRHIMI